MNPDQIGEGSEKKRKNKKKNKTRLEVERTGRLARTVCEGSKQDVPTSANVRHSEVPRAGTLPLLVAVCSGMVGRKSF